MTQSNVTAAVEDEAQSPESIREWLGECLAPMFDRPRGTFRFGGAIEYLQAIASYCLSIFSRSSSPPFGKLCGPR